MSEAREMIEREWEEQYSVEWDSCRWQKYEFRFGSFWPRYKRPTQFDARKRQKLNERTMFFFLVSFSLLFLLSNSKKTFNKIVWKSPRSRSRLRSLNNINLNSKLIELMECFIFIVLSSPFRHFPIHSPLARTILHFFFSFAWNFIARVIEAQLASSASNVDKLMSHQEIHLLTSIFLHFFDAIFIGHTKSSDRNGIK